MNPPDEPVKPTQTSTSDNECPALVPKGTSVPEANVDHLLGVGLEREKTYVSCAVWLNKWLSGDHNPDLSYNNRCYPKSLVALSMDYIKGDHMLVFAGRFGKFFANNSLRKVKGAGVLDASTKFVYFKAFRKVMYQRFPEHEELQPKDTPVWWTDLMARFKREAEQCSLRDPSVSVAVKSAPLYRDTSADVHGEDFSAWGGGDIWHRAAERGE